MSCTHRAQISNSMAYMAEVLLLSQEKMGVWRRGIQEQIIIEIDGINCTMG